MVVEIREPESLELIVPDRHGVTDAHAAVRYLADASAALAEPAGYMATLERLGNLIVPAAADWCTIDLIDPVGGGAYRVASAHVDAEWLAALERWQPRRPPTAAFVTDGVNMAGVDLGELAASYLVAPLEAHGAPVGTLTLGALDRRYHPLDVVVAEELGRRAGDALDRARQHDEPTHRAGYGALRDLLDLTALEDNQLGLHRDDIHAADLVAEVLDAAEVVAARRGVRIVRRCGLHGAFLHADRERIAQAFANIVGHALTACRDEVVVRGVVGNAVVQLAVADDGDALGPVELAQLYAPHRNPNLAIARGIVLAHGGSISVACTPGEGSTFVVSLPLRH